MTYRGLLFTLDRWFADATTSAGPGVVLCRRGCAACCHGPFDISPADAELAADAVGRLHPSAKTQVRARAQEQVARYRADAAGWDAPWDVEALGDETFDIVAEHLAAEPCPALGDDGACLIYDDRPATCRMIGLAILPTGDDPIPNACPIINTSARYAALDPVPFDLERFESDADAFDVAAFGRGWVSTTVAGAIESARLKEEEVAPPGATSITR
ncbi:MAG TPA: YkgJ family cysteine cluster protein [Gemmatimonadales bacterium]